MIIFEGVTILEHDLPAETHQKNVICKKCGTMKFDLGLSEGKAGYIIQCTGCKEQYLTSLAPGDLPTGSFWD